MIRFYNDYDVSILAGNILFYLQRQLRSGEHAIHLVLALVLQAQHFARAHGLVGAPALRHSVDLPLANAGRHLLARRHVVGSPEGRSSGAAGLTPVIQDDELRRGGAHFGAVIDTNVASRLLVGAVSALVGGGVIGPPDAVARADPIAHRLPGRTVPTAVFRTAPGPSRLVAGVVGRPDAVGRAGLVAPRWHGGAIVTGIVEAAARPTGRVARIVGRPGAVARVIPVAARSLPRTVAAAVDGAAGGPAGRVTGGVGRPSAVSVAPGLGRPPDERRDPTLPLGSFLGLGRGQHGGE